MRFDILLKNGRVIDALTGFDGRGDVGIKGGKIAAVAASLPSVDAESIIDAEGYIVMPGVIDSHVHVSTEDRWIGFSMMASVGVVTAVDFRSNPGDCEGPRVSRLRHEHRRLHTVTPGHNTKDANPSTEDIGYHRRSTGLWRSRPQDRRRTQPGESRGHCTHH